MYALNSTTGALLWQYSGLAEIQVTAAVANGSVYFGACNGNFYSLNASTGALNWQVRLDGGLGETSSPAVANGVVYAGTANSPDLLYALDASTGAVLWQYATKGPVDASPQLQTEMSSWATPRVTFTGLASVEISLPQIPRLLPPQTPPHMAKRWN